MENSQLEKELGKRKIATSPMIIQGESSKSVEEIKALGQKMNGLQQQV